MLRTRIRIKHAFYDWAWPIAIGLLIAGTPWLVWVTASWLVVGAFAGTLISSLHFITRQKLEEVHLFDRLFRYFNERYDKLNEKLHAVVKTKGNFSHSEEPLTNSEKELFQAYFNLCAEEFLYFKRGYVYVEVWDAWSNGMRQFFSHRIVREYWKGEAETGSYYGFKPDRNQSSEALGDP